MAARRLMVLGGGRHQVSLIRRARERDIEVVLVDYLPDAPGHQFATISLLQDTLDAEAATDAAREHRVDGVVTTGTDLPVMTMAHVARRRGLPTWIDLDAAATATRKPLMHTALREAGVPLPAQWELAPGEQTPELALPFVAKPADSQGQRGVTCVRHPDGIDRAVEHARANSATGVAVLEEFLDGPEITVNAWVEGDRTVLLAVNDRVTYNPPPYLGVAFQHVYPSVHGQVHLHGIADIMQSIAGAYRMRSGPLYVQMIVTNDRGPVVVEAAARVGGGHESSLFPLVAGSTVEDRLIDLALTGSCRPWPSDMRDGVSTHAGITFVMGRAGVVQDLPAPTLLDGTREHAWYVRPGSELADVANSLGRIGYFLTVAEDRAQFEDRTARQYESLVVSGTSGEDLVLRLNPQWVSR